eukprot:TRINITY_DN36991_c0_g1_i4.p1 TRINITY_DN36991_c0_g1~~TRINITY_DN36991_c0_g1_i4.p1  ORF type:complete len:219 (+),score=17.30 TRINITY_DN36991_c0_g1_i4:24-659(+)
MDLFDDDNKIDLLVPDSRIASYRKVLEFTCQVMINCEHQINKYSSPCGTMLATVAQEIKSQTLNKKLEELSPCTILYSVAVRLSSNKFSSESPTVKSGLSLFLMYLSDELLLSDSLSQASFQSSLNKSLEKVKRLGWQDQMLTHGLEPFIKSFSKQHSDGCDLLKCLEEGASAAEQAALTTKINAGDLGDAGAHAVGVFTRALFQAFRITS